MNLYESSAFISVFFFNILFIFKPEDLINLVYRCFSCVQILEKCEIHAQYFKSIAHPQTVPFCLYLVASASDRSVYDSTCVII